MFLVTKVDYTQKDKSLSKRDNFFIANYEKVLEASCRSRRDKSYPVILDSSLCQLLKSYKGKEEWDCISWNLIFDEGSKKYIVTEAKARTTNTDF